MGCVWSWLKKESGELVDRSSRLPFICSTNTLLDDIDGLLSLLALAIIPTILIKANAPSIRVNTKRPTIVAPTFLKKSFIIVILELVDLKFPIAKIVEIG